MLIAITILLKFFGALLALTAATISVLSAISKFQTYRKRLSLIEDENAGIFLAQFNTTEIDQAISGYIVPHCSPSDPSNRDGEEFLADTRESIFNFLDRTIQHLTRSYHLLLADTGMGKTAFCINYFYHARKTFKLSNVCLISLSSGDAPERIRDIPNKSNCILIADALDEDPKSLESGRDRMFEILTSAADFKFVLLTCRSQYFLADDSIPRETPLPILIPRKLGQSQNFSLVRSYISPFDKNEIRKYISKHFPIWKPWKLSIRFKAHALAEEIPDLAYRPMLLERLPEIVTDDQKSKELYDLYDLMVEGWIQREGRWINTNNLRSVSYELALYIYSRHSENSGRITAEEIGQVAIDMLGLNPDWKHLTSRSLLNRDSKGRFKFAHKSILEFLLVKLAISGDDRPTSFAWTPFMKELFVSWGHSSAGKKGAPRAKNILKSAQGRKNVAPLYDVWAAPASAGLPDFKRSSLRRTTHTGTRMAPTAWRSSSMEITALENKSGWIVFDNDFHLTWFIVNNELFNRDGIDTKFIDVMKLFDENENYKIPSYDQIISLAEGIHPKHDYLLPSGSLHIVADKPSNREYLLVSFDVRLDGNHHLKSVDKDRKISGTKRLINSYIVGTSISLHYARSLRVRQVWIIE